MKENKRRNGTSMAQVTVIGIHSNLWKLRLFTACLKADFMTSLKVVLLQITEKFRLKLFSRFCWRKGAQSSPPFHK